MNDYAVSLKNRGKALGLMLVVSALVLTLIAMSSKRITLIKDDKVIEAKTYSNTVEEFLNEQGIEFKEKGYINYPLDGKIENNMELVIRSPKTYTVHIGSEVKEGLVSTFNTVDEVLEDLDIQLGSLDYTEPQLRVSLKDGDTIKVFQVRELVEENQVKIPYEKVFKDNPKMDKGTSQVIQQGEDGLKLEKIKKRFVNDELESTEIVETTIAKNPITHLAEKGTRQLVATSRGKSTFKKSMVMNATAYDDSPASQGKWVGITASGTKARVGAVAVDPRVIPLGTRLYVESLDGSPDYGYCVAEDTGGAIKGNRIDLFYNTKNEVRRFGRRKVKVYILD